MIYDLTILLDGRDYSGPSVIDFVEDLGSHFKAGSPAFIIQDGSLFDIQYAPLDSNVTLPPYPDPSKYETFFDFEEAIKEWKRNVETILSNVQLPTVTGRHYYRPFKPKNNNLRVINFT